MRVPRVDTRRVQFDEAMSVVTADRRVIACGVAATATTADAPDSRIFTAAVLASSSVVMRMPLEHFSLRDVRRDEIGARQLGS